MEISPATAVFFEVPENWKMVKISSFVDVNVLYLFPSFLKKRDLQPDVLVVVLV